MNPYRFLPLVAAVGSLLASGDFAGSPDSSVVRIGVFGLFHSRQLTVHPHEGRPFTLNCGEKDFRIEGSQSAHLTLAGQAVECRVGDLAALTSRASIADRDATFVLEVPGGIERRYRGALAVQPAEGELEPVICMPLETAVASIVAAESPANANASALQAQAVVTRSYLAAGSRHKNSGGHRGFDFCDTTHCQYLAASPGPGDPPYQATRATSGMILIHQGNVLRALYSARCGGETKTLEDVGLSRETYPYYRVSCPPCLRAPDRWTRRLTKRQAAPLIQRPGNEAARLQLVRRLGWQALPSNNYQISAKATAVSFQGVGAGHGLGLCQQAAQTMAAQNRNFQSILRHYFPNVSLASAAQ
jgi:cytochrome c5